MKKFLIIALTFILIAGFWIFSFAGTWDRMNENTDLHSNIIINSNATWMFTAINASADNTASIDPATDRVIGYSLSDYGGNSSTTMSVALFDNITASATNCVRDGTNLFSERQRLNTTTEEVIFPYPKRVSNGVGVYQSPCTIVEVFSEEHRN